MTRLTYFRLRTTGLISGCLLAAMVAACSDSGASADEGHASAHGHVHYAPHGGALIVCGEEAAHVELLLDGEEGRLTAYVLDSHASQSVRLEDTNLLVQVEMDGGTQDCSLDAVANSLTGETVGNTSEFAAVFDFLKGQESFRGTIPKISIRGATFEDVTFRYPEGNETEEDGA